MTQTVLGGSSFTLEIDLDNPFEISCMLVFQSRVKDKDFCALLWSALANVVWKNPKHGQDIGYSFRAAGDLIAAIRGEGTYTDWYCSGPAGVVSSEIAEALAPLGWTFEVSAKDGIKRGDY